MYVQQILETRVGSRVYVLDQCKESDVVSWRVRVLADPGSYRASEEHTTIITEIAVEDRETAVQILNAIVETALDAVASPF